MSDVRQPALVLGTAILVAGCALRMLPGLPGSVHVTRLPDCPGPLVPSEEIPGTFLLRQDVRVRSASGTVDVGLRLIAQKKGTRLVLVGFTTLGLKAFTVVQEGARTTVEAPLGPAWAVPPLNVLRDLHRSRFLGVPDGPFDGDVRATRRGVAITERWRHGRLVERSLDGPGGRVRATFGPDATTLVHEGCGYTATIVTTEERSP